MISEGRSGLSRKLLSLLIGTNSYPAPAPLIGEISENS
jgi:hypothetical protein